MRFFAKHMLMLAVALGASQAFVSEADAGFLRVHVDELFDANVPPGVEFLDVNGDGVKSVVTATANFSVLVTATSYPFTGPNPGTPALLSTTTITVETGSTGGTLRIAVTDIQFSLGATGPDMVWQSIFTSGVPLPTGSSIEAWQLYDSSDRLYGGTAGTGPVVGAAPSPPVATGITAGSLLGSGTAVPSFPAVPILPPGALGLHHTVFGDGTDFSETLTTTVPFDSSFGFTEIVQITLGADETTSFTFTSMIAPVPEPSSIVMMGLGVVGLLGFAGRRRKNRKTETVA